MKCLIVACLALGCSKLAKAEATFAVAQTVLTYQHSTAKVRAPSGNTRTEESGFETTPPDLEIAISYQSYTLYLSPTQPGAAFAVGYLLALEFEVGLGLAFN